MDHVENIVVGGGVVGLAICRELNKAGRETILLEKNNYFGEDASTRNSGVIHAGIYYNPGSLKAQLCVKGNKLLYEYAKNFNVPFKKLGKIIYSNSIEQNEILQNYLNIGLKNSVELEWLNKEQIYEIEPELHAIEGIYSKNSGVIDVGEFIYSLLAEIQRYGGQAFKKTKVIAATKSGDNFILDAITNSDENFSISCKNLINSSGLYSEKILNNFDFLDKKYIRKVFFGKGHYFAYSGNVPFKHLIYPLPGKNSLGIHLCFDCHGGVRFGPDHVWTDKINYDFEKDRKEIFLDSIKTFWSGIEESKLTPDYVGLRAKIYDQDSSPEDFCISLENDHGVKGFINLQGIESPGLTSSLAISEFILSSLA